MSLSSYEVAEETARNLKDRMGWSEDVPGDVCACFMRLCEIVDALQIRLEKLEKGLTKGPTLNAVIGRIK